MADILTRRRSIPPQNDLSGLSPRDKVLARVEALLQEELLSPPETLGDISAEVEEVNPDEIVEISRLVPPMRPAEFSAKVVKAESAVKAKLNPPTSSPQLEANKSVSSQRTTKSSAFNVALQIFILLFVMGWVFILGIVVGRGHVWESGYIYDLVLWLEEQAGWASAEEPPSVFVNPPLTDDELSWQDVRQDFDHLNDSASNQELALNDQENLTNSQWLAAAPSALNFDRTTIEVSDIPSTEAVAEPIEAPSAVEETQPLVAEELPQVSEDQAPPPVQVDAPGADPVSGMPTPPGAPAETSLASSAPGMAGGKFAVQIVSAFDEAEANKRVEKLRGQGFPAYYYKTSTGRFPVRVGRFEARSEAAQAKEKLEALGYRGLYLSTLVD